jgi:hypothetical protein
VCLAVFVSASACVPEETASLPITLQPPYDALPAAPPGTAIEAGMPVPLDARQQEAVAAGVAKWMKDPRTPQFTPMQGARNGKGLITVCGQVSGRGDKGSYLGMAPYVGVLMGPGTSPDFVMVGIGGTQRERAEVTALCRDSGITV